MIFLSKAISKSWGLHWRCPVYGKAYWPLWCSAYLEIRRISSVCHPLMRKATVQLMSSFIPSCLDYCNSSLTDITSDQMYGLKKKNLNHAASHFSQKQTWACFTTYQKASLAASQRKDTFQDSHLCFSLLWSYPAMISVILFLCVHSISWSSFQFQWKNSFLCKMKTQELWSPVVLCSGAPCLEQSFSAHPTQ